MSEWERRKTILNGRLPVSPSPLFHRNAPAPDPAALFGKVISCGNSTSSPLYLNCQASSDLIGMPSLLQGELIAGTGAGNAPVLGRVCKPHRMFGDKTGLGRPGLQAEGAGHPRGGQISRLSFEQQLSTHPPPPPAPAPYLPSLSQPLSPSLLISFQHWTESQEHLQDHHT